MELNKELTVPFSEDILSLHHKIFDEDPDDNDLSSHRNDDRNMIVSAREKLAEVICSLLWEKDNTYKYTFPDTPHGISYNLFYDDIFKDESRKVRKDAWAYTDVSSGDGSDIHQLMNILNHTGEDSGIIAWLFYCDHIPSIEKEEYLSSDELRDELTDELESGWLPSLSDDFEECSSEETEAFVDKAQDFLVAYSKASKGEEFSNDLLDNFLYDLKELWGELSDEFFFEHMDVFCYCLFEGNCEKTITTSVVTSKDIYRYYHIYRERLPESVRNTVDSQIELLLNPFGKSDYSTGGQVPKAYGYMDDTNKVYALVVSCQNGSYGDYSYDFVNANPFLEIALLWLDRNLPLLEAMYGSTSMGASAS